MLVLRRLIMAAILNRYERPPKPNEVFKLFSSVFIILTVFVQSAAGEYTSSSDKNTGTLPAYVPGELIIKLKPSVDVWASQGAKHLQSTTDSLSHLFMKNEVSEVIQFFKGKRIKGERDGRDRLKKIKISKDRNLLEVAEEFGSDPNIEYAEPNYICHTFYGHNDPRYSEQWAHQKTQAEVAWDIERGDSSIIVAIIDTGIDYTHEDLSANIWHDGDGNPGCDFVDINIQDYIDSGYEIIPEEDYTDIDYDPSDINGHGTHCAGIAAARGDNGIGVVGVSPDCRIMPVRAGFSMTSNDWETGMFESDDIAAAIMFAADNGAKIISMSFGSQYVSQTQSEAIDYAYSKGVVLVAAAGNYGVSAETYPAGHGQVIAVASTDSEDEKTEHTKKEDKKEE